jgi:hypothetical protein
MQTVVDDFHAGIAQRGRHDFGAAIVSIKSGFGDEYSNGSHAMGS